MISSVKMESSSSQPPTTQSYVFSTPSNHPTSSSPSSSSSSTTSSNFSVDTLLQHQQQQIYTGTTYTYFNPPNHPTSSSVYSGYYNPPTTQNGAVYVAVPPPPQFDPNYPVYDRSTILNEKFLNEKRPTISDVQHLSEPNGSVGVKTTPAASDLVYYPVNKENSDTVGLPQVGQVLKEFTSDDSHVNQDEMSYDEDEDEDEEDDEDDDESENEESLVKVKSEHIEVGRVLVEEKRVLVDDKVMMVKLPGKRGRKKNTGNKKVNQSIIESSNFSLQVFISIILKIYNFRVIFLVFNSKLIYKKI